MRFARYLQHLERGMEVPYPEREGLVREIASHLHDLYDDYRGQGLSEAEAEARAMHTMALDESFITTIDEVHAPFVRRALATLPPPLSMVIEHYGIGLLAAVVFIAVILREEAMLKFFTNMGVFMLPLNLIGLAILTLAGERIFSLYIKKDHATGNLNRRLLSFKFLGLSAVLVGLIGTLVGYFEIFTSAAKIAAAHGGKLPIYKASSIAISTTIWGLTLALMATIAWYIFRSKAVRIEEMQVSRG